MIEWDVLLVKIELIRLLPDLQLIKLIQRIELSDLIHRLIGEGLGDWSKIVQWIDWDEQQHDLSLLQ